MENKRFWLIFFRYFCFIGAAVCFVLTVVNASSKPPATSTAVVFAVVGVALLFGGGALTRVRTY